MRRLAALATLTVAVLAGAGRADATDGTTTTTPARPSPTVVLATTPTTTPATTSAAAAPAPATSPTLPPTGAPAAPATTVAATPTGGGFGGGTGGAEGYDVAVGSEGIDSLVPSVDYRGKNAPTLLERYPPGAYQWDTDYGISDIQQGRSFGAAVADFVLECLLTIGIIVVRVVSWAFSSPPVVSGMLDRFVASMASAVFLPYALALLVGVGLYVAWQTMHGKVLDAVSHGLWCVKVVAVVLIVAWAPGKVIGGLDRAASYASRVTMGAAASTIPTPAATGTATPATFSGDPSASAIRMTTDAWWRLFVFTPWATGELGSATAVPGAGEAILGFRSANDPNLSDVERRAVTNPTTKMTGTGKCDGRAGWDFVRCTRKGAFENYRDHTLEPASASVGSWVNGKHPWARVTIGLLAIVAALASGLILLVVSLGIIYWTYAAAIRVALVGFVGLRAFDPVHGRGVFTSYLGKTAAMYVKRVGAGLLLATMALVYGWIGGLVASRGWLWIAVSQIMGTVVLVVLIAQHRKSTTGYVLPRSVRAVGRGAVKAAEFASSPLGGALIGELLRAMRQTSRRSSGPPPGWGAGPSGGGGGPGAAPRPGPGGSGAVVALPARRSTAVVLAEPRATNVGTATYSRPKGLPERRTVDLPPSAVRVLGPAGEATPAKRSGSGRATPAAASSSAPRALPPAGSPAPARAAIEPAKLPPPAGK